VTRAGAALRVAGADRDVYFISPNENHWIRGMSWRQRFGLLNDQTEAAALKAELSALQVALERCHSVAGYCERRRRAIIAAVAVLALVTGFTLGAGFGHIRETMAGMVRSLAPAQAASDTDAAYTAYRRGKIVTAIRMARPLAEAGDARAQSLLGYAYYHGRGAPRDDAEALRWFRRAGEAGDAEAQFHLGVINDAGVPPDHAEAAVWYARAAAQGHAQAQYNLGLAYATGEGVQQDNVRAYMWFNLAAARFAATDNHTRGTAAGRNRDVVAGKMTREDLAEAQRLAREWKAM
jgi:TPR repeat protein